MKRADKATNPGDVSDVSRQSIGLCIFYVYLFPSDSHFFPVIGN